MPEFTGSNRCDGFQNTTINLKVVTLGTELSLQVTDTFIKYMNTTAALALRVADTSKKYINATKHLGFLLRDYNEKSLVYAIVLEFFTQTGGVY